MRRIGREEECGGGGDSGVQHTGAKPATSIVGRERWEWRPTIPARSTTIGSTEMANVKQTQKMIPFVECEISLGQYVCELVFGVNVFDLDFGIQINSIEQPIKSNSVGSGNMSHCRTSSLENHLDQCFVVFKHIQQGFLTRRIDVRE